MTYLDRILKGEISFLSLNTPHQLKELNRELAEKSLPPVMTCRRCGYLWACYHYCLDPLEPSEEEIKAYTEMIEEVVARAKGNEREIQRSLLVTS